MSLEDGATFIAGSPRSGTTLMTSLLDGHQALTVFPEEFLYLREYPLLGTEDCSVLDAIFKKKVRQRLQGQASYLDSMHEEGRDYTGFSYDLFAREVNAYFAMLSKEHNQQQKSPQTLALLALILGFARATGHQQASRWVIKNPRYELFWQQIFADFPTARIIYMVRDPRKVILSRSIKKNKKKHLMQGGNSSSWKEKQFLLKPSIRFLQEWQQSIYSYHAASNAFPGQVLSVRYEDLVTSPQQVMHTVAEFLSINWSEALLAPSFFRKPWKGGSMHGQSFDKINQSQQAESYTFAPHHQWQVEAWLCNLLGEKPGEYTLSELLGRTDIRALFSRLPGESLLDFARNRMRMLANQRKAIPPVTGVSK